MDPRNLEGQIAPLPASYTLIPLVGLAPNPIAWEIKKTFCMAHPAEIIRSLGGTSESVPLAFTIASITKGALWAFTMAS